MSAYTKSVLRLMLNQGVSLVLMSVVIGFAAALLVGRVLGRMLDDVAPSDPGQPCRGSVRAGRSSAGGVLPAGTLAHSR
jgi:hypothetical protein